MKKSLSSVIGVLFLFSGPSSAVPSLKYLDDVTVPTEVLFEGSRIGGLSALWFDSKSSLLYALSDDPADLSEGRGSSRFYVFKFQVTGGKCNVTPQAVYPITHNGKPLEAGSLDPEAWVTLPNGNFLVSSEGEPGAKAKGKLNVPRWFEMTNRGEIVRDFQVPSDYMPKDKSETLGLSPEQGFEALATAARATQMALSEGPLYQDRKKSPPPLRALQFSLSKGKTAKVVKEWDYFLDPITEVGFVPTFKDSGVSEMLFFKGTTYLTLERSFFTDGVSHSRNVIRLFATEFDPKKAKVEKKLALDFDSIISQLKKPTGEVNHILDNVEGLSWGPDIGSMRTLIFVTDDNFKPKQRTKFYWFSVEGN